MEGLQEQGKEVSALDEKPDPLEPMEEFYLSAFIYLGLGRNSSMGVGAIPLGDIGLFYDVFGAPHNIRDFAKVIRSIDSEFVKDQRKD